jgi:multimeric flavodoxin WrbA
MKVHVDIVNILRYFNVDTVNIGVPNEPAQDMEFHACSGGTRKLTEEYMECLILNGNPKPSDFDDYLTGFASALESKGYSAKRIDLRDLDIKFCTGCWSCWWATPGRCSIKDDLVGLYPDMVKADLVLWASPLVMGAVSALLKKTQDRFIPLIHPYIVISKGEMHHRRRYQKNADVALIVEKAEGDTDEDLALAKRFFERFSLNTRTNFRLFATSAKPIQEAVDETLTA